MSDILSTVTRILRGSPVSPGELQELARRYPAFRLPDLALIASGSLSPDELRLAKLRLALAAGTPEALHHISDVLPDAGASFTPFYPPAEAPATPSTVETIDRFLSTYGSSEAGAADDEETRLLERLILNPVAADYASVLAAAEGADALPAPSDAPPGSHEDLINRFILSHQSPESPAPSASPASEATLRSPNSTPPSPRSTLASPILPPPIPDAVPVRSPKPAPDDSLLSESLAKIYIRQHDYVRAYEIIERLNLNFPEKSIYFADQLRFLRKIIDIQSKKSSKA